VLKFDLTSLLIRATDGSAQVFGKASTDKVVLIPSGLSSAIRIIKLLAAAVSGTLAEDSAHE
jgi:hypothetical protein